MMNMNMNPAQMLAMLMKGGNPQKMVMNMLGQQAQGNPILENVLTMAKNNDGKGIEAVARNTLKEKGYDFDKEFNSFKNNLGL